MTEFKNIKRDIAYKVYIKDILDNEFIKAEGEFAPNYVMIGDLQVSRVNIIGFLVQKDSRIIVIDDSSSSITVRNFDEEDKFNNYNIGDMINIIGKIRVFNDQKYVNLEIIRKVDDPLWMKIRLKELNEIGEKKIQHNPKTSEQSSKPRSGAEQSSKTDVIEQSLETDDNINEKENLDKPLSKFEEVINLIESNDKGGGVNISDIISKSGLSDCDKVIESLLLKGEIFEIKPGVIKVL